MNPLPINMSQRYGATLGLIKVVLSSMERGMFVNKVAKWAARRRTRSAKGNSRSNDTSNDHPMSIVQGDGIRGGRRPIIQGWTQIDEGGGRVFTRHSRLLVAAFSRSQPDRDACRLLAPAATNFLAPVNFDLMRGSSDINRSPPAFSHTSI